jgi:AcrR family transcriptional regulator
MKTMFIRSSAGASSVCPTGRERVIEAAYALFSRHGTHAVGVDAIVAAARVAKMTLYRHFCGKDELILAYLARHQQRWSYRWLQDEVNRRTTDPAERLLAVFDVLAEWFARPDFAGCPFITTMLERGDPAHPVRKASVAHLARIRGFLRELATAARIADPAGFSHQWHLLIKGAIIAAEEGDTGAAYRARELGVLLLHQHGLSEHAVG